MKSDNLVQQSIRTPIGPLYIVASTKGICAIQFEKPKQNRTKTNLKTHKKQLHHLKLATEALKEYFKNNRTSTELTYDLSGTSFQKSVWQELIKIPCGETRSYLDIAKGVRKPKAFRAVGTAIGKNPIAVMIPCHRVIASNGTIGGYAGGIDIKKRLLSLEVRT